MNERLQAKKIARLMSATNAGSLWLTAFLVHRGIPKTIRELALGRALVEPFTSFIPDSQLYLYCAVASASVYMSAGMHGDGTDPFVRKVFHSAGYSSASGERSLELAREGRYDEACEAMHPGCTCYQSMQKGILKIMRVALRDVTVLGSIGLASSIIFRNKRPELKSLARTYGFIVAAFTTIRAMNCTASAACHRVPVLNNVIVTNWLLPLWFGSSMFWIRVEPTGRQRQLTVFALASAVVAVLKATDAWPDNSFTSSAVAAYFHPSIRTMLATAVLSLS